MKKVVSLFLIIFSVTLLFGQEEMSVDKLFKYGRFDEALPLYLKELENNSGNVDLHYRVGFCYLQTNVDKAAAIEYFEYAKENGYKDVELNLELGQAYLYAERIDDALTKFNEYKNLVIKDAEKVSIADKHISFCNNAKELMKKPLHVEFENLGDRVNSSKSETMPFTDFSEAHILYTTNRKYVADFGEFVTDIYTSEYKYGRWKRGKSVGSRINTSVDHEYIVGAAPNLEAIIVRPESYEYSGDILISYNDGRRMQAPVNPGEPINAEKTIESSACLSSSGDTLYFASDREGGFGGFDIYYSLRIDETWGIHQNLGSTVNTPYNDEFPSISTDGKTLYFASEGHNSMGGYDIFITKYNTASNDWGQPKNFGYPINTTYDDFNISLTEGGRYGYVAQIRKDGEGEYDIYKAIFEEKEPYFLTYTGIVAVGDTASYSLIYSITDEVKISVLNKADNTVYGEYKPNENTSKYVISLPPGKFQITVNAKGYPQYEKTIDIPEIKPKDAIIILDVFFNNTPIEQVKKK